MFVFGSMEYKCRNHRCGRVCTGGFPTCCQLCPNGHTDKCENRCRGRSCERRPGLLCERRADARPTPPPRGRDPSSKRKDYELDYGASPGSVGKFKGRDVSTKRKDYEPDYGASPGPMGKFKGPDPSTKRKDYEPKCGASPGSVGKFKGMPVPSAEGPHDLVKKMQGADRDAVIRPLGGGQSSKNCYLLRVEDVVKDQLSDHMPQIYTCGETRRIRVLTWNIMTRCRYIRSPNNGYGKNETGDEYQGRLREIAVEVAKFFRNGDPRLPMVAVLQECPQKEEFGIFIQAIKQGFPDIDWSYKRTDGSLANATLWDGSKWRQCEEQPPRDGLRALILKLAPVSGGASGPLPYMIANVHLEYKATPEDKAYYTEHVARVAEAVRPLLQEPGLAIVAGDFNLNVVHLKTPLTKQGARDVVVEQMLDSSQVWKDGHPLPNTVDGVIWKN